MKASKKKSEISPLMQEVSAYIAGALKKPLPKEVVEKTKHHVLDTIAAMVSGSRLLPGKKAISYVKTLGGAKEACVIGSRIVTTARARRARQRHAGPRRRDRRLARALALPSRLRHRARGAGDGRARAAQRHRAAARGRARLRRRHPRQHGAARLRFPRCRPFHPQLRPDRSARRPPPARSRASTPTRRAGCSPTPRSSARASRAGCATRSTSRRRSTSAACPRATASPPPRWSPRASPASRTCSPASAISSSPTTRRAASAKRRSPSAWSQELGSTYEIMNTNIKRWSVGSPIQAPLDSLLDLIREHGIKADDVEKLTVRVAQPGRQHHRQPQHARHLHAAHVRGDADRRHRHLRLRARREAHAATRRCSRCAAASSCSGDEELTRALPSRQGIVELRLKDGRELRHHTKAVRGTAQNPMTRAEVDEKATT